MSGGKGKGRQAGAGLLGESAAALEIELERFDALVETARTAELGSEKQLERAARTVGEALESQQRIATLLGKLVDAINEARGRQERGVGVLAERANEMKGRRDRLEELLGRYAQLGSEGAQINALVSSAGAARAEKPDEAMTQVREAIERMASLVEHAGSLAKDANEEGFAELHRQVDTMRQQVAAARNKLVQVERSLGGQASGGGVASGGQGSGGQSNGGQSNGGQSNGGQGNGGQSDGGQSDGGQSSGGGQTPGQA